MPKTRRSIRDDRLFANPFVAGVSPYRTATHPLLDLATAVRLDGNEEVTPPSARAVMAAAEAAAGARLYPDPATHGLKATISTAFGIEEAAILCGHGSEELIFLMCRALLSPGDEVVMPASTFSIFRIATAMTGAQVVRVPERRFVADVDALLNAVTPRTRIVALANPNNPTGTWIPSAEVWRLRRSLPDDVVLMLDAAYADYVGDDDYSPGDELVRTGLTLVLRTFSKAHALAGLRVGWAHAPEAIAELWSRVKPVFNLSAPAEAAAAASLADTARLAAVRAQAARAAADYQALWDGLGLDSVQGAVNFSFVSLPDGQGEGLHDALARANILTTRLMGYDLPDALRISFGSAEENARVAAAVRGWAEVR